MYPELRLGRVSGDEQIQRAMCLEGRTRTTYRMWQLVAEGGAPTYAEPVVEGESDECHVLAAARHGPTMGVRTSLQVRLVR